MKALLAALLLVVAGSAPAQYRPGPPVARFNERDDGAVVQLPVGAEIIVQLPEQGGVPMQWELRDEQRVRYIREPRTEYLAPPGVVGGPSARTFRLQVTAGGRIPLVFQLRSPIPGYDRGARQRVTITIDASSAIYVPTPIERPGQDPQIVTERDANGIVLTYQGQLIEIHLPVNSSTGYSWQVLSARNIAFDAPPGVEYRPGILGFGRGEMTTVRLRTTIIQSDGFLTLVYMPPGQRADRFSAARTLNFQFHNQRRR